MTKVVKYEIFHLLFKLYQSLEYNTQVLTIEMIGRKR